MVRDTYRKLPAGEPTMKKIITIFAAVGVLTLTGCAASTNSAGQETAGHNSSNPERHTERYGDYIPEVQLPSGSGLPGTGQEQLQAAWDRLGHGYHTYACEVWRDDSAFFIESFRSGFEQTAPEGTSVSDSDVDNVMRNNC